MNNKETLDTIKQMVADGALDQETAEKYFPELAESEDERIRKAISQCVEDMRGQFEKLYRVHHKDAIAWLEKQGEQKPASEDLEAFVKERVSNVPVVMRSGFHQLCRQLIRDGAKWQEEKDDEERVLTYKHGFEDCKEQMMKDAVEAEIEITSKGILLPNLKVEDFDYADKARLIIIKEDEL